MTIRVGGNILAGAVTGPYKANIDMDNLTSQGQNIANWSNNVTNCITEIPQDIKLELNNGTLTLKAGSKVYVPNGAGVFDTVTINSDLTLIMPYNGTFLLFLKEDLSELGAALLSSCYSGPTNPAQQYSIWYDTSNNRVDLFESDTSTPTEFYSLSIAKFTVSDGAISSIDQVFNGFGYIGSTVFALPNVKGLIPNGRNADGSLKNTEFTTSSVFIDTISGTLDNSNYYISANEISYYGRKFYSVKSKNDISTTSLSIYYVRDDNLMYTVSNQGLIQGVIQYIPFCGYSASSSKITSFTPKTAFHALDYNDSSTISGWSMPDYSAGVSITFPFTAPTDGLVLLVQNSGWNALNMNDSANRFISFGWSGSAHMPVVFPIAKDDKITTANNTYYLKIFYPLKGEN